MYDFTPGKSRRLVYGDFCLAIRLSFAVRQDKPGASCRLKRAGHGNYSFAV
jgi:hypothetical protein